MQMDPKLNRLPLGESAGLAKVGDLAAEDAWDGSRP
jgi:hypothetical protein